MAASPGAGKVSMGPLGIIAAVVLAIGLFVIWFVWLPRLDGDKKHTSERRQTVYAERQIDRGAYVPSSEPREVRDLPMCDEGWVAFEKGSSGWSSTLRVPAGYRVFYLEDFASFEAKCSFLGASMGTCDLRSKPTYDRVEVKSATAVHYCLAPYGQTSAPPPPPPPEEQECCKTEPVAYQAPSSTPTTPVRRTQPEGGDKPLTVDQVHERLKFEHQAR